MKNKHMKRNTISFLENVKQKHSWAITIQLLKWRKKKEREKNPYNTDSVYGKDPEQCLEKEKGTAVTLENILAYSHKVKLIFVGNSNDISSYLLLKDLNLSLYNNLHINVYSNFIYKIAHLSKNENNTKFFHGWMSKIWR